MINRSYKLKVRVWLYTGVAAWHFVTLPKTVTRDIDFHFSSRKRGWGSLPVLVSIGSSTWKTSIFPDKKSGTYLLPIKADVRKKEGVSNGNKVNFNIQIKA